MFVASYRNTERSIRERSPAPPPASRPEPVNIRAEQIIAKAKAEAEEQALLIVSRAREEAQQIIDDAHAKVVDMLGATETALAAPPRIPGIDIIKGVANKHGVTVTDLRSPRRPAYLTDIRQEAMALVYQLRPDLSLPAIARLFNKDHTTVLHAVRKLGVYRGPNPNAPANRASRSLRSL